MSDRKYNGWTNYETWCVNLWLDNDEGSSDYWRERAREAYEETNEDDDADTRRDEAAEALRGELESAHDDMLDELAPSINGTVFSDLMRASLSEVNWGEIACHFVESIMEDA